jgi:hypothetical protein
MVAAKDRLWLIKIYSPNVGLEPTTLEYVNGDNHMT